MARFDDDQQVYQPAEDSDLLAAVPCEQVGSGDRVLEVGAGSGYVSVRIARETDARVVAADLNPHACRQTRERAREAGVAVEVVRANLADPFRAAFDAVLFNPPYIPGEPVYDDWMGVALSGGESGRAVIDPFLDTVAEALAPGGAVYLLVSSLTGVEAVAERAAANGFHAVALADASFPFETLTVLKLVR